MENNTQNTNTTTDTLFAGIDTVIEEMVENAFTPTPNPMKEKLQSMIATETVTITVHPQKIMAAVSPVIEAMKKLDNIDREMLPVVEGCGGMKNMKFDDITFVAHALVDVLGPLVVSLYKSVATVVADGNVDGPIEALVPKTNPLAGLVEFNV